MAWYAGSKSDGSDSIARQVVPATYWPQMHILILVVSIFQSQTSPIGII